MEKMENEKKTKWTSVQSIDGKPHMGIQSMLSDLLEWSKSEAFKYSPELYHNISTHGGFWKMYSCIKKKENYSFTWLPQKLKESQTAESSLSSKRKQEEPDCFQIGGVIVTAPLTSQPLPMRMDIGFEIHNRGLYVLRRQRKMGHILNYVISNFEVRCFQKMYGFGLFIVFPCHKSISFTLVYSVYCSKRRGCRSRSSACL